MMKIIDSTYVKVYREQVYSDANHMDDDERNKIIGILTYFEDLFDGTLGYWDT